MTDGAGTLLADLSEHGVELRAEGSRLRFRPVVAIAQACG